MVARLEKSPGAHAESAAGPAVSLRAKALLPILAVLLAGLALFVWVSLPMAGTAQRSVLLIAAAGAVAICAVLLVVLAVLVQRPLDELREKIARVSAGDLTVQVDFAARNDEIGELGRNFNEMVRQMRESRDEIQRLHQTQMTRAEHLATLGEIAAGLAHEIRNPLAGIAGVLEVVGRDVPDSSPAKEVLGDARHEVQRIQRILSDLLGYARPKPPNIVPADLSVTIEHAVKLARQQAASKNIEIEWNPCAAAVAVRHDAAQIEQVILNILLNAIQAIDNAGRITVEAQCSAQHARIIISDTGRGMMPDQIQNAFRPFYTTKRQGTGLGLSLARRIVEAHSGRIDLSSTPGQGTTFTITLPAA